MSIISEIIKNFFSDKQPGQKASAYRNMPSAYTQSVTETEWHGVALKDLNDLAKVTSRGVYAEVDEYGFLVFHYTSKSGKTRLHAQCELDNNNQLVRLSHSYYPGQWCDSADIFVKNANQKFSFK